MNLDAAAFALGPVALAATLALGAPALAQETRQPAPPACTTRTLPELYDKASPAVVSISATSVSPYDVSEPISRVVGSGFIVNADGVVLTNSHLVFGRQAISVTLDDGTQLPARLLGADPVFDIAVIQIPKPDKGTLATLSLGDSDQVVVGEEVLAIGNPLGLEQTLTHGIVSALSRLLPDAAFSLTEPLIQTDAPINPGNSGGPLVNTCGEVVGITSAILPEAQNIGFAIPVNLVKQVVPRLLADGRVIRPWLGIQGELVSQPLKDLLKMPLVDGLLVEVVEPGSPAEHAGLNGGQLDLVIGGQPVLIGGDIITALNDAPLQRPDQIGEALKSLSVGATVRLTVTRDSKTLHLSCVLTERPLLPGDAAARQTLTPLAARALTGAAAGPRRPRLRL
jgi:S1-C subfamily serine protease